MRHSTRLILALVVGLTVLGGLTPVALSAQVDETSKPYPSVPFVVGCGLSHESNDDPIIHPGHAGMSHHHIFFGNRSTDAASTAESLKVATTTCEDPADRASYWLSRIAGWVLDQYARLLQRWCARVIVDPAHAVRAADSRRLEVRRRRPGCVGDVELRSAGRPGGLDVENVRRVVEAGTKLSARIDFPQCWDGGVAQGPGKCGPRGRFLVSVRLPDRASAVAHSGRREREPHRPCVGGFRYYARRLLERLGTGAYEDARRHLHQGKAVRAA